MKIEFEVPDYCKDCQLSKIKLDTINVATVENPGYIINILRCENERVCAMWAKRLKEATKV